MTDNSDVPAGWDQIGPITFDPSSGGILGKGCEGTVVYRCVLLSSRQRQ